MKFKGFFILSLILFATIVLLDFFAFKYFLYWHFRWFDKPMHFLGGFLVALVALQLYFALSTRPLTGWRLVALSVFSALLGRCLWAIFELNAERLYCLAIIF